MSQTYTKKRVATRRFHDAKHFMFCVGDNLRGETFLWIAHQLEPDGKSICWHLQNHYESIKIYENKFKEEERVKKSYLDNNQTIDELIIEMENKEVYYINKEKGILWMADEIAKQKHKFDGFRTLFTFLSHYSNDISEKGCNKMMGVIENE